MIRAVACIFALLMCATFTAAQDAKQDLQTIYKIAPAKLELSKQGDLSRRVESILQQQGKFLTGQLHPWDQDPHASLLTRGGSGENDIRPNAHLAFGLAVLARSTNDSSARDHAVALLRFLLPTHGAGDKKCADGKQWHNQWQSAYWAYSAGKAAWLLWDDLDEDLRYLAARMICDEADRFVNQKPPMQIARDTKAEENAWDSTIVALAFNMFPNHPRHEIWRETAIRWQINSFVTTADTKREDVIDGKPLKDWLVGANIYDDYTLENHDRVHPDYMGTIRINLHQKLIYGWAGNAPPQSLSFNAEPIYANLKKLALPDGNYVYPNGQDWQIHRNADWIDLHTAMTTEFADAQAARLLRISLETCEGMLARDPAKGIQRADEVLTPTTHSIFMELYADTYLLLRWLGEGPEPVEAGKLWKDLAGVHVFDAGKFAVVRTDRAISTFSWGRQVMGMCMPLGKDLLLTPNDRSLIGEVASADKKKREQPVVERIEISQPLGGFAACGILSRAGGAFHQHFAFIALADGRALYTDRIDPPEAASQLSRTQLGVANEASWIYHNGQRTLVGQDMQANFRAVDAAKDANNAFRSPWLNLDGLGIICPNLLAQVYHAKPSPIRARLEQILSINAPTVVFFPNQTPAQTEAAFAKCKIAQSVGSAKRVVELDDGKKIEIDLDQLKVTTP